MYPLIVREIYFTKNLAESEEEELKSLLMKVKAQAGLSRGGMTWLVRAKLATAVTGGAEGKPQVWAVH